MSVEGVSITVFIVAYVFYLLGWHDCENKVIEIIDDNEQKDE